MIGAVVGLVAFAGALIWAGHDYAVENRSKSFDERQLLAEKLRERGERIVLGPAPVTGGVGKEGVPGFLVLTEQRLAFIPSRGFDDDIRLRDVRDVREARIKSWGTHAFVVDVGDGRPRTFFTSDRATWMRVIRTAATEAKAAR